MSLHIHCAELGEPLTITLPENMTFRLMGQMRGRQEARWVCVDTGEPVGSTSFKPGKSLARAVVTPDMPRTYKLEGNHRCFDWIRRLIFRLGLTRAAPGRPAFYSVMQK